LFVFRSYLDALHKANVCVNADRAVIRMPVLCVVVCGTLSVIGKQLLKMSNCEYQLH
jgi:hypothetical protein